MGGGCGGACASTFDRVRGVIAGATLTITCETPAAVEIEWMVIAERADPFIKQWDRTNPDGYLVTQYSSTEAPVAPADPVAPSDPAAPSDPVAPADPVVPADPVAPVAPAASSDAPAASSDPADAPADPVEPAASSE